MQGHIVFGRSALRRDLLTAFFSRPGFRAHVREIARITGHAAPPVGRELGRLEAAGVLRSETVGRSKVYRLDSLSQVVRELRPVVQRTIGAEAVLRRTFDGLPGVDEAFIFGSYGTNKETARSDIDVMVIGRPTAQMWARLVDAERTLGREVNVKHYTRSEVDGLRKSGSEFIRSAFAGRRLTLVGEEDDRGR